MNQWIPIFKAGVHTDSNGNKGLWTEADLDNIVKKYLPQLHEAPVVIGHPKDNAPAYAWVKAVKREGDMLYYQETKAQPEFDEMRRRGMFKKRSISLYPDGSLRHIGYLGAMPPAIKGLPDVAFSDDGGLTIEFEDGKCQVSSGKCQAQGHPTHDTRHCKKKEERTMKFFEWIKGLAAKDGVTLDDMPPTFSEADVQAKVEAAVKEKTKQMETAFSEKITALDADKAALSAREEALRQKEAEARQKAVVSFCEDLKKKGVLTPAMEKVGMGITEFMQVIAPLSTVVEFSEGNVKKNQTPLEFMQAFLSALPKQIEFGEVAGGDKGEGGNSEKREALISNFMEKNRVSYRDAVLEVSKSNPELFKKED